jgi:DNA-directed RNA polymerase specialized sigma24 family protein
MAAEAPQIIFAGTPSPAGPSACTPGGGTGQRPGQQPAEARDEGSVVTAADDDPRSAAASLLYLVETPPGRAPSAASAARRAEAGQAVADLYRTQYGSLVRLAALLTGDADSAERVVQDSFVAMHSSWGRVKDYDKALSFLRRSVVSRTRLVPRSAGNGLTAPVRPSDPAASLIPARQAERDSIVWAIGALPAMQREAVVFRFYLDLPEGQIATAMGVTLTALRDLTAKAVAALKGVL